MAGAAELPRPGVEVIQEFRSVSPTIVTPTLVPCNIGPFFEVIEVLDSDGTTNSDAQLTDPYVQVNVELEQSSLPSPRGNIDEVDVLEDTIRVFFDFGGELIELGREDGFHLQYIDPDVATRPYVVGTVAEPGSGYDLDGRTLIMQLDSHTAIPPSSASLPTSADVTITFAAATTGARLTLAQVITQINALLPGVAMTELEATTLLGITPAGAADQLALVSTSYGAGASVVVRKEGSANAVVDGVTPVGLGFDPTDDEIAVGSGFYASDDSDGDSTSPRLKVYAGAVQVLLATAQPWPAAIGTTPNFSTDKLEQGDTLVADGVDIGEIETVEADQLTMEVEQNLMSHSSRFAPRRIWVQANNLEYPPPATSTQATLTGAMVTEAATQAFIVGVAAPTFPIGASESFTVNITVAGVAQTAEVISSGAGWADLAAAITDINSKATNFESYAANKYGDQRANGSYLGLRTLADNTGSSAGITYTEDTGGMTLGFTTPPYGDVGENIRYAPGTKAVVVGGTAFGSGAGPLVMGESVTYTPTVKGTAESAETIPTAGWSAAHTDDEAGLLAAIADWNADALYTEAYRADSAGAYSATGLYFAIRTLGENYGGGTVLPARDAQINVTATDSKTTLPTGTETGDDTDLNSTTFKWSMDFNATVYEVILVEDEDTDAGGVSLQQVIDKINELTPGVAAASSDSPPYLKLTSQKYGGGSKILIGDGTANGAASPPSLLGFDDDASNTGAGRPAPDLAIDTDGDILIQSQILRDGLTGLPFATGTAPILVAYKGLRLDLSPDADDPSLLVIDDIDTLEAAADPISTDNPGALMCYLSLINAPSVSVAAIGVPEVSADAPEGTPLGYSKCFEFLESEEVYALACASHVSVVHQAGLTHVNSMSEPEQKGERILFFNPEVPDRALPDLVGSGTDANSTPDTNILTVDVNLAPALIAAGIDPNSDINPTTGDIENEVYIDLGSDDKYYLIQSISGGTEITLRTSFATGENSDAFYSSTELPSGIISDDWSVFIRGDQLLITGTTRPDYASIAETVQATGQAYGFRRGYYVFPDQVGINVSGLEQLVNGYYATSCIAGMVGELPPQQGFTNYPITGLTRVVGSNDSFTNSQLNVMAAGGVYILIQDVEGAPVICRHQLSTDMTSIETRELSITKIVDYCAKFMRTGLRGYIGRSNITQPFLDNLAVVVQGQIDFLSGAGVIIGADINNLIQDADNPDTVLIDVTLDVPYPCNYIRLTLIV